MSPVSTRWGKLFPISESFLPLPYIFHGVFQTFLGDGAASFDQEDPGDDEHAKAQGDGDDDK